MAAPQPEPSIARKAARCPHAQQRPDDNCSREEPLSSFRVYTLPFGSVYGWPDGFCDRTNDADRPPAHPDTEIMQALHCRGRRSGMASIAPQTALTRPAFRRKFLEPTDPDPLRCKG